MIKRTLYFGNPLLFNPYDLTQNNLCILVKLLAMLNLTLRLPQIKKSHILYDTICVIFKCYKIK